MRIKHRRIDVVITAMIRCYVLVWEGDYKRGKEWVGDKGSGFVTYEMVPLKEK